MIRHFIISPSDKRTITRKVLEAGAKALHILSDEAEEPWLGPESYLGDVIFTASSYVLQDEGGHRSNISMASGGFTDNNGRVLMDELSETYSLAILLTKTHGLNPLHLGARNNRTPLPSREDLIGTDDAPTPEFKAALNYINTTIRGLWIYDKENNRAYRTRVKPTP
jgi:hypothetical protein